MSRSAVKPAMRSSRAASSSHDGALRHRFLNCLQILRAGMQKKMNVGIDQSRKQRAIAQVDDLRSCGMFDRCSDFDDAFALHQNLPGLDQLAVP